MTIITNMKSIDASATYRQAVTQFSLMFIPCIIRLSWETTDGTTTNRHTGHITTHDTSPIQSDFQVTQKDLRCSLMMAC
jgi:hypothetical protein